MSLATDVRDDLVTALEAALTVPVQSPAPPVPLPPMVAVTAGTPWQSPQVVGGVLRCEYRMRLMCAVRDDASALPQLEQLVEDACRALPEGWSVDTVTAPASLDTGAQGSVLVAEVLLTGSFQEDPTP